MKLISGLRKRFFILEMVIVTVLLLCVLLFTSIQPTITLKRDINTVIDYVFAINEGDHTARTKAYLMGMPFFLYTTGENGVRLILGDMDYFELAIERDTLVILAMSMEADKGTLSDEGFAYECHKVGNETYVALVDCSAQARVSAHQRSASAILVGILALIMIPVAYVLSGLVEKPLKQALEAQQRFSADASHQLKTPLAVILSNADMMLNVPETMDTKHLEIIRDEALNMRELTEHLIRMVWVDTDHKNEEFKPQNISSIVESVLLPFESSAYEKRIELVAELEPDIMVLGNAISLRRMCLSLLDNAIKYTPPHKRVTVRLEGAPYHRVQLTVNNTGCYIEPEKLNTIFERFYRDRSANDERGFGLGLSIARGIVELHNGEIHAASTHEDGVTFTVKLKRCD